MAHTLREFDILSECNASRLKLWQCPPMLVIFWGFLTIIALIATYVVASRYGEEEVVVLSVTTVSILFLTMGGLIIASFNRIAEASRMKSEFISIASHQLRSPLSIFKWTLDIVEREFKKVGGNSIIDIHLPTLRSTAENMTALVNSILTVSRIEARTLVLRKERFSLVSLTRSIVDDFKRYAEASHITITLNASSDARDVFADREQVGMVVYNLLDNAVRYTTGPGNVTITIRGQEKTAYWAIHDEGVGIPQLQQKYIFQRFFRAANTLQKQTKGTGIGLYIAREIVEALGGTIGFTSDEGRGSTFWFTLPTNG